MTEGLAWPPTKEDLERLYLVERLSAAKIARAYGLKYKNPKVAESTVLFELKRNGIKRRDPAEHFRKVNEQMVDKWKERYEAGESLKQIAGKELSPVTVFLHLRRRGIKLRDKVEAQIQAVTKYERKPFRGNNVEKAYLMGLRYGDLHVVKHGRAIRVRVSTTHPSMADLFESLFARYGHVARYPRKAKLVGFEWTLECDLDDSFEFLLPKPRISELEALSRAETLAFLAGLFDAEGSVFLHDKRGRYNPEVTYSSTEDDLLEFVCKTIQDLGLHCKLDWVIQSEDRQGVTGYSREGRVVLWRFRDVQEFLGILPVRHLEKVAKAQLVRKMEYRSDASRNLEDYKSWERLTARIETGRLAFVEEARKQILSGFELNSGR